jgi:putative hydrolase of the HAD superfamily
MKFQTIAFDADDTLWVNEPYYRRKTDQFLDLLREYGDREAMRQRLSEIEIGNVVWYGYGIKSFMFSMIEAAIELTGGKVQGGEIRELLSLGREMLVTPVECFQGVEDLLSKLSTSHRLMLITKGDLLEQQQKVDRSGLSRYFTHVEIVLEKTALSYRNLFDLHGITPKRFLMAGNSLRSDILPVIEAGGHAVYVPYENTWSHEMHNGSLPSERYYELEDILQLPDLVRRLEGKKKAGVIT